MKTIIDKLDLLKKAVTTQQNFRKKYFLLLATKLVKNTHLVLVIPKNTINLI